MPVSYMFFFDISPPPPGEAAERMDDGANDLNKCIYFGECASEREPPHALLLV